MFVNFPEHWVTFLANKHAVCLSKVKILIKQRSNANNDKKKQLCRICVIVCMCALYVRGSAVL